MPDEEGEVKEVNKRDWRVGYLLVSYSYIVHSIMYNILLILGLYYDCLGFDFDYTSIFHHHARSIR